MPPANSPDSCSTGDHLAVDHAIVVAGADVETGTLALGTVKDIVAVTGQQRIHVARDCNVPKEDSLLL